MTRKIGEPSDACPFPPDMPPPPKTLPTNLLEQVDWFFEGWRNYLGLVTVMGLLLAYSLLVVPPPLITRAITPDTWNTQLEPSNIPTSYLKLMDVGEPDQCIQKQMVVQGDEVLEFVNQTIEFRGLVLVKDSARIILRNSTLITPNYSGYRASDIFSEPVGMLFNGTARLEAYDSIIVRPGEFPIIGFIGSSSCLLENTVVANCSLGFDESATLEAMRSTIYTVQADSFSSLNIIDSHVDTLRHSNLWRLMGDWHVNEIGASVYLEDSTVRRIVVRVVNSSSCHISNVAGYQDYWNIYDAFKVEGATMNVTLKRSTITESFRVYAVNSEVSISSTEASVVAASMSRVSVDDSNVAFLYLYSNSSLVVKDSNIYYFGTGKTPSFDTSLIRVNESRFRQNATIMRTRIERLWLNSNCKLNFTDVYVGEASLCGFEATLTGSVTWGPDISDQPYFIPYNRFAFTQVFMVRTHGPERVLPRVNLVLTDKEGNTVWEGVSDENGEASFNLTFCSYYCLHEPYKYVTNYMDRWNLKATYGDETREAGVVLCETGSPIVFEFPEDKPVLPISNAALTYASVAIILLATAMKLGKLH